MTTPAAPAPRPFAELVRHRRVRLGLTQVQLADRAGLSVRRVQQYERPDHRGRPYPRTLDLLATALRLAGPEHDELVRAGLALDRRSRTGCACGCACCGTSRTAPTESP